MAAAGRRAPRHRRPGWRLLPAAALAALTLLGPLLPLGRVRAEEPPSQSLKRVEEQIETEKSRRLALEQQAQAVERELDELRARLVELAARSQEQETQLAGLESESRTLEAEERAKAAQLQDEQRHTATLLAALQRLSRVPPEAVIARPAGPLDTLRSAILLRDTVPALRARAAAVAEALAALGDARARLDAQRARVIAARLALEAQRADLDGLIARREELARQTDGDRTALAQRVARLAWQATDTRQLMAKIERERRVAADAAAKREAERLAAERRQANRRATGETAVAEAAAPPGPGGGAETASSEPAPGPPPPAAVDPAAPPVNGGLRLPTAGAVQVRFGQPDRFGGASRGVTIAGRPGAAVVAPYSGSIMFAGPFRGYGQILIVEHSNGYHSLIAGLGRIDTAVGRYVATGEPVGSLPWAPDGTPDLYFELRRHGQPINPQRGFAMAGGKGQG